MTSKLTREQLHERARENVKALKMASRQHAFESAREEILADLQLAELALAAMDSEPDCKERKLFCSTDTARMRKVISVSAGTGDAPLYRHAQPVPVVSADLLHTAASAIEDLLTTKDRTGTCVWFDLPFRLRSAANAQPAPVVQEVDADDNFYSWFGREWRENYQHNQYTTAAKQMLGVIAESAWKAGCRAAMLAAAPQSPGSEPATVPGKWIPVSEQMPEVGDIVLTAMGGVVNVGETECSAANCRFFTSVISGRELPATHWMPLPAAPQEVK